MKTENTFQIEIEKLAPPGIHGELIIINGFANDTRTDDARLKDNSEREFLVTGKLSRTVENPEGIKAAIPPEDGDSYLIMPEHVLHAKVQTLDGVFEFQKNARGELAQVRYTCLARSIIEAKHKFAQIVVPYIDYLSFIANCPIQTPLIAVNDTKNDLYAINYVSPHPVATVNPHVGLIHLELSPVYALYREAKNSSSDFYKFLCYYKIIEGVLGALRRDLFKRAKKAQIKIETIREILPEHPELLQSSQELVGKSVQWIFENFLNKKFRNAVAHFITDTKTILNVSTYESQSKFANAVLVAELCSRVVIATHVEYLQQLKTATT